jgi:ketosteroid isomerase-like protein
MTTTAETSEATRALGRRLVDTFGAGWSGGDVELLMSIFAPEAVFQETPFSSPVNGLEAIKSYWGDVPYHQSEVSFTSGEIFGAGPWFAAEFKCSFRRRRSGDWVEARGALFCETDGEKITEMRMYWHRWNGGRETSRP